MTKRSGINELLIINLKNGVETTNKKGNLGPIFAQEQELNIIINPPTEIPTRKKLIKDTSPKNSGA